MAGQQQETRSLWVFGYGSLCWMPGFQFGGSAVGYIQDYVRRFWQGNTTHRGTPAQPGRVATLVEEKEGCTWGVAYELKGEAALQYLEKREVALGGYNTSVVTFFPRDPKHAALPSAPLHCHALIPRLGRTGAPTRDCHTGRSLLWALRTQRGPQDAPHAPPVQEERRDTFQYSTKLPPKKLRCLNV
ncbi:hypothetical protein O3P69_009296 [Scylla paramamosain]|uniref:glutathione-specific gamma-glutamylcyclotransferase n=1 Tax=Scylla paramamosain TaxID=85552 RepID=A0AAW0TA85_SCYPA